MLNLSVERKPTTDLDELTEDQWTSIDRVLKILGFGGSKSSNNYNEFNSAKDSCNSPPDKAESFYTSKMVQAA
jgi:hypothetical protein